MPFDLRCVGGALGLIRAPASDKGLGLRTEIGIPADRLERLFRSFSQTDASIRRRYGGTGLGLAISKRLAEAMGGTMWAESTGVPGEGSGFHVRILARVATPQDAPMPGAAVPLGVDAVDADRHPLDILLVEDNTVDQKLALRLLSRIGYAADVAVNGREAVEAVELRQYDLVLMDVQMPEMDGLEATRRIVERLMPAERPRIVAMTANALDGDGERCLAAGMDGYIAKPIRVEDLLAALVATPTGARAPTRSRR